jgi:T-complex protein 1 subunit delta
LKLNYFHFLLCRAFANALEVIPLTLAENAGMSAINVVTELRKLHAEGNKNAGLNVKKGAIANILDDNVVQPLLVTLSVINLATETVASILKIDDIVSLTLTSARQTYIH